MGAPSTAATDRGSESAAPPVRPGAALLDVVHVAQAMKAGLRRHVVDLALGLHELGVRQAIVYSPDACDDAFPAAAAALRDAGIALLPVHMPRRIRPAADARACRDIAQLLRRLRPGVVHLHSSKAGGAGRIAALAVPATRVVYSPHASAANLSPRYALIERALGRLRTDRLIAVSASEEEELASLGYVARGRLVRVDCGLSADEVRAGAARPLATTLPGGPLVVAAGRLAPQKDPEFLVRVSALLAGPLPSLRFVWVGDGEERACVERAIERAGVADRWTITGWLANPYPVIARAAVFALPSRYESFGYVTLEAMALARPVVATAVTGSRDLVLSGVTGALVAPGDERAFADAVASLVRDPERAAAWGRAGAERAEAFSRDRMCAATLGVYEGLR